MPVAVGRWRFRGEVIAVFVGRWWQLFWGSKVVCFSAFARLESGRCSPAWFLMGGCGCGGFCVGGSGEVLGRFWVGSDSPSFCLIVNRYLLV